MTAEKRGILEADFPANLIDRCVRAIEPAPGGLDPLQLRVGDRRQACGAHETPLEGARRESAIGAFPVRAVEMMARIATEVEAGTTFKTYPASDPTDAHALSDAATAIAGVVDLAAIVVLTTTGYTLRFVAAQRLKVPVVAITMDARAYHSLNLFWGVKPLLVEQVPASFEEFVVQAEATLRALQLVATGEKILVIGGMPTSEPRGSNSLRIHIVG